MSRRASRVDRSVRRLDTVDAERLAATWSSSDIKRTLFEEVTKLRTHPAPDTSRSPLRPSAPRGRLVAVVAAALLLVGGTAIASGVFRPDPEDVRTVLDFEGPAYEPGALPVLLDTSGVWCAYEDGLVGVSSWHNLALDEEMTHDHLIEACTDGPDQVRFFEEPMPEVTDYTACEAMLPGSVVQRHLDETGEHVIQGRLTEDRPAFPIVLGWQADCTRTTLESQPELQLRPLVSLAQINRAREIEIGLRAQAARECLSLQEVLDLAQEAQAQLDGVWVITDTIDTDWRAGAVCFSGVRVDPVRGVLSIAGWGG